MVAISESEQALLDANHVTVARRGREQALTQWQDGRVMPMEIEAKDRISFEAYLANGFSDLPAQPPN